MAGVDWPFDEVRYSSSAYMDSQRPEKAFIIDSLLHDSNANAGTEKVRVPLFAAFSPTNREERDRLLALEPV